MQLSDLDKRAIGEAGRIMAEAGRIDFEKLNEACKAISKATPTAEQAMRNFHVNTKALKVE